MNMHLKYLQNLKQLLNVGIDNFFKDLKKMPDDCKIKNKYSFVFGILENLDNIEIYYLIQRIKSDIKEKLEKDDTLLVGSYFTINNSEKFLNGHIAKVINFKHYPSGFKSVICKVTDIGIWEINFNKI